MATTCPFSYSNRIILLPYYVTTCMFPDFVITFSNLGCGCPEGWVQFISRRKNSINIQVLHITAMLQYYYSSFNSTIYSTYEYSTDARSIQEHTKAIDDVMVQSLGLSRRAMMILGFFIATRSRSPILCCSRRCMTTANVSAAFLNFHCSGCEWYAILLYVYIVITHNRVWINRVRLPILLVLSCTGK